MFGGLRTESSFLHPPALDWPQDAHQENGQWTPDGKHFFFTSYREGLNNIYQLMRPPWFEFWKKPIAGRLTAGQIEVLAAASSRDNTCLFIIGRIAQGAMHIYDPKQKRFVYRMLEYGQQYVDKCMEHCDQRYRDPETNKSSRSKGRLPNSACSACPRYLSWSF